MLSLTLGINLEVMDDGLDQFLNDQATHVRLFGKNGRRQFGSPPPLTKLIRFINVGGEPMVRQREELINILIRVDEKEHPGTNGPEKVKETIKVSMETGKELSAWLESCDNKFPKPTSAIAKSNSLNALGAIAGCLGWVGDIATDGYFTRAMRNLYQSKLADKPNNCSSVLEESLDKINKTCRNISDDFNPMECTKYLGLAVQDSKCLMSEENRFENANKFLQISTFSWIMIILPFIVSLLCGITLAIQRRKCWKLLAFFPPVARTAGFIAEWKLNCYLANPKENEKKIKEVKKEIEEHDETINLAMQIEANVESSFQFSYQVLYSLPVIVLAIYSTSQAQSSSILESILTEKSLSILLSFISIGYSFVTIREESCVFICVSARVCRGHLVRFYFIFSIDS